MASLGLLLESDIAPARQQRRPERRLLIRAGLLPLRQHPAGDFGGRDADAQVLVPCVRAGSGARSGLRRDDTPADIGFGGQISELAYDGNGNLASESSNGALTTYTWDEENRLSRAQYPGGVEDVCVYEVAQSAPLLAAGMNGLEEGTDSMSVSSSEVLEVGGGSMPPSTSCRGR